MTGTVTFVFAPAVIAGVIAAALTLVALTVMLAVAPTRFPLNPLYLTGSAFSIDTTHAYISGLCIILLAGAGYGVVISAVLTGYEVEGLEFLWGALAGIALSIVTGSTLGYSRSLNRAVRAGQLGHPGPFLLRYGRNSMIQLLFAHTIFGLIAGAIYAELS